MSDDAKNLGTVQIALRIAPELRERVKRAADANNRSVNSELTATLEEKYPAPVSSSTLASELALAAETVLMQIIRTSDQLIGAGLSAKEKTEAQKVLRSLRAELHAIQSDLAKLSTDEKPRPVLLRSDGPMNEAREVFFGKLRKKIKEDD